MNTNILSRLAPLTCASAVAAFAPDQAIAADIEQSSLAMRYVDEVLIGGVILGAIVALDTASWSFMTTRR